MNDDNQHLRFLLALKVGQPPNLEKFVNDLTYAEALLLLDVLELKILVSDLIDGQNATYQAVTGVEGLVRGLWDKMEGDC